MSADTRSNEELLDAARNGDETTLAVLVERHRDRLERVVRLRMDRRLQGRVPLGKIGLWGRSGPARSPVRYPLSGVYACVPASPGNRPVSR